MWIVLTLYNDKIVDAFGPFGSEDKAQIWAEDQEFENENYALLIVTSPNG